MTQQNSGVFSDDSYGPESDFEQEYKSGVWLRSVTYV